MKKIVVTGGMGYIGSHTIVEILKKSNWRVYSIDNFINSRPITQKRLQKITGEKTKNFNIDLCDLPRVRKVFQDLGSVHSIIHFAALKSVEESVEHPLLYYRNNINSLINLLQCCQEFKIRNFIYSSSCSIYGEISPDLLPVNEKTIPNLPQSPYADTKLIGENLIKSYFSQIGLNAVSLRYFNPIGADPSGLIGEEPAKVVRNLLNVITRTTATKGKGKKSVKIFGKDYNTRDGTCIRDYIHVSDIARAHIDALFYLEKTKKPRIGHYGHYQVINLGTGNGVTVLEIIKAFEKISGISLNKIFSPRRLGDVMSIYSDSRKSKKLLNWEPIYGIDEMVKTAWNWELSKKN